MTPLKYSLVAYVAIQDYIRFLNERDAAASPASPFEKGAPAVPFVPENELLDPDR